MKRFTLMAILASMALWGCSVTVVPRPVPTGTIDLAQRSLTLSGKGVTATVRVQDLEYAPYRLVENITSFHLTLRNDGSTPLSLPPESFVLLDDQGMQYRPVTAEKVKEIVGRDSAYLIPYPYVGYYYLEDTQRSAFHNTFTSELPFYAETHPQDIFTEALPAGPILPGAQIAGLLYFVVDLTTKTGVELRLYLPGTPETSAPDLHFPFSVEK